MTPAERALLLAVAKYVHPYVVKKFSGLAARSLDERIAAVEAEAAFAADDEAELAEVAEKAEVIENIPLPAEFQAFFDAPIPPASALDSWQPSYNRRGEADVCPTCKGSGNTFTFPGCNMHPCPDCNGTGGRKK